MSAFNSLNGIPTTDNRFALKTILRSEWSFKGFTRVHLRPGEKKTVNFLLGPRELGFYSQEMKYVVEPGVFKVWVAWNSFEG